MAKLVIGITGKNGVGKTEASIALNEYLLTSGHKVQLLAFADPLKDSYCEEKGITLYELEKEKRNKSSRIREELAELANVIGREKIISNMLEMIEEDTEVVIISDVRLKPEVKICDMIIEIVSAKKDEGTKDIFELEDKCIDVTILNDFVSKRSLKQRIVDATGMKNILRSMQVVRIALPEEASEDDIEGFMGDHESEGLLVANGFGDKIFLETPVDVVIVTKGKADIILDKKAFRLDGTVIELTKDYDNMPLAEKIEKLLQEAIDKKCKSL